jgi:2-phospho-L-lactate transferase/gluconeogenesis factor (CofD/UPF0052 family)
MWSDQEFRVGDILDTKQFCRENRAFVESLSPEYAQIEALLSEARETVIEERTREVAHTRGVTQRTSMKFMEREFPDRLCSILAVPWPMYGSRERSVDLMAKGRYCYYVMPKRDSKRLVTSESWVDELFERWHEIRGTKEAEELAKSYWRGNVPRGYGMQAMVIEGQVLIEAECPQAERVEMSGGWR